MLWHPIRSEAHVLALRSQPVWAGGQRLEAMLTDCISIVFCCACAHLTFAMFWHTLSGGLVLEQGSFSFDRVKQASSRSL